MIKTGSMCPISGSYLFVKHIDQSPCMLKHDEIVSLERDDIFPLARDCGNPAFWVLMRDDLVDKIKDSMN